MSEKPPPDANLMPHVTEQSTSHDLLLSEELLRNHAETFKEVDYARLQTLHLALIIRLKELQHSQ